MLLRLLWNQLQNDMRSVQIITGVEIFLEYRFKVLLTPTRDSFL